MSACHMTRGLGGSTWVRALFVSIVLLTLGLVPLANESFAGTYTATDCHAANAHSAAGNGEYGHHMLYWSADCGAGGNGLGIALPQNYSAWGYGQWTVGAPANTHFVSINGVFRGVSADGWLAYAHAGNAGGIASHGPFNFGTWQGFSFGPGYYNWYQVQLICTPNYACPGSLQAGAYMRDVSMIMSDDAAPSVGFAGGPLLDGKVQRDVGSVNVEASDQGAGLKQVYVLVNDQLAGAQNYPCNGVPMVPCPLAQPIDSETGKPQPAEVALDTQSTPFHDGANTLQACAVDVGAPGNVTCTKERAVQVDNSCTPSKVAGGTNLNAFFPRTRSNKVTVRAGRGALLKGRLTDAADNPIANATICAREAVPGQPLANVGTVQTNDQGRYRYGVPPGPNRNLQVAYRVGRNQLERGARFNSHVRPVLRVWPRHKAVKNGHAIRLHGSIPGPRKDSRTVILQARYPHSKRWNTFSQTRTGGHGKYVSKYRFLSTFVTTKYAMRAVVPEQRGYPFERGASRIKRVKVIGRR